jgi:N-acetylglucosamine-6-phosphate deacetylase
VHAARKFHEEENCMATLFYDATVFTPQVALERGAVVVSDEGKITFVGEVEEAPQVRGSHINLRGRILAPGLVDVHVHGGNGVLFGEGDLPSGLDSYSKWVAGNGVTGFLLSIAGPDAASLTNMIKGYAKILGSDVPGAEPLGLHLEGPFINREKKGGFNPDWIRPPSSTEVQAYLDAGQGWISQMTLAPEMPAAGDVAKLLRQAGIVAALGHTNTDYATASKALKGDFTHVTHTFNAQSSFNHRNPGVFGAILSSDYVTAELICDGIHVHPAAMNVLIRCLGTERVVLITDAIQAAGMKDGKYTLVGSEVFVKDGIAREADGTLAGSTATLNRCVRNVHQLAGIPLLEAVKMASLNPCRAMGFADRLGSIYPGKDASLTVIDEEVNVYLTMVKGQVVYNNL